ncbi:MAG: RtcB family protein [Kiritimatiellaeota bacterium]|nr:RtcB family protein [Kiritimatiellota bacterium]
MFSYCETLESGALGQLRNLAHHPIVRHIAVMPDCHSGYGMPIGGVIACEGGVIPNAVGVDIGCGMVAVATTIPKAAAEDLATRRKLLEALKRVVPVGEGRAHKAPQHWEGFDAPRVLPLEELDYRNLGTLGGGNHFMELQSNRSGFLVMMVHTGSRNLGYRICNHYHKEALAYNERHHLALPDKELAFLPEDTALFRDYVTDMTFAMAYAQENRKRIMAAYGEVMAEIFTDDSALREGGINIHHNYAGLERHFGKDYWIHRKGATSAFNGQPGIIPGSMGTSSYIVRGKGNPQSMMSCSHGAGRAMSRTEASKTLTLQQCDAAMEGVVFDRWQRSKRDRNLHDLGEAPQAYKDIDDVIRQQLDCIDVVDCCKPLMCLKG